MICGGKKRVRHHELAFMGIVADGCYGKPHILDDIFNKAKEEGELDQIWNAKDAEGNLPLHKAALHGNPTVMQWVIDTWQ